MEKENHKPPALWKAEEVAPKSLGLHPQNRVMPRRLLCEIPSDEKGVWADCQRGWPVPPRPVAATVEIAGKTP